jgi:hypothetical protein
MNREVLNLVQRSAAKLNILSKSYFRYVIK